MYLSSIVYEQQYTHIVGRSVFMTNGIIRMSLRINTKSKSEKKIDDEKVFLLIKISPQPDESFPQIICIYVSRLKYSIFYFNDSRHAK